MDHPSNASSPSKPARYGSAPANRYPPLSPLFWHGLRIGDWLRLLRDHQWRLSGRGWRRFLTVSAVAAINSTMSTYDRLKYGSRIRRVEITEPPLFVLGHWRSGTTLLHELLIRDPRHTYPTTYQCFAPHHFNSTERWVTPVTGWLLPAKRPMDNVEMGWKRPQEDEFALMNLGLPSPYRCWAFPGNGPIDEPYLTLEGLGEEELAAWRDALRHFVRAVSLKDSRRVVLKSPPHTARVRELLKVFPDAVFVHLVRDPRTLYPSTVRMWQALGDTQGLQRRLTSTDWIEPHVLDNLEAMYNAYERDRQLIPDGRLVELRYEDLIADPRAQVQRIYDELPLGDFGPIEPALDAYLQEKREYKANRYELEPHVEATLRERWGWYFEEYGY